ncbi:hypothetical protein HY448_00430 [Candidatus Pacearchaeota archaeon]|nr:hypothetical protein [Candidatus Pacearchaeota archaeon]
MDKKFKFLSFLFLFGVLAISFVFAHELSEEEKANSEYKVVFGKIFGAITGFATDVHATTISPTTTILIAIDSLGILLGFMVLIFLLASLEPFRGKLRTSYVFMGFGIFSQVIALLYTVIFVRLKLFEVPFGLDVHHLLMTLGLLFFAFAIYNLREVVKGVTTS